MTPRELEEVNARSLNAPYGARCFLTRRKVVVFLDELNSLNAPYGARCFLTGWR